MAMKNRLERLELLADRFVESKSKNDLEFLWERIVAERQTDIEIEFFDFKDESCLAHFIGNADLVDEIIEVQNKKEISVKEQQYECSYELRNRELQLVKELTKRNGYRFNNGCYFLEVKKGVWQHLFYELFNNHELNKKLEQEFKTLLDKLEGSELSDVVLNFIEDEQVRKLLIENLSEGDKQDVIDSHK